VQIVKIPVRNGELEGDPRYSHSLERGLAVWQLAEIADKLGYARSTTHRYLLTLVALGQIEQTTGRRYRKADG
jgi:DNA-binding MarR family transcriptional regulator